MMFVPTRTLTVVLLGAVLAGCSPKAAELVLDTQQVPPATVVSRVTANAARITALKGSGTVSFEGPGMGGSAFFSLTLKKPDSLLIRFEGPFGLDAGFLFLSRSQYVMFNRLENAVYRGDPSRGGIRWAIPFDLTVEQVLDAFTGAFRFPAGTVPSRYAVEEEQFLLSYTAERDTQAFWVDPATALVTRYSRKGNGVSVWAETSRSMEEDGMRMPREIMLSFPSEGRQLSVYYNDLTLNPSDLSFQYSVPRTAQARSSKP
jgi:hypothetical protein